MPADPHTHDEPVTGINTLVVHLIHDHGQDMATVPAGTDWPGSLLDLHGQLHPESRPSVYPFIYYLHDDGDLTDHLTRPPHAWGTDGPRFAPIPADIAERISADHPFYEVTLHCEYDVASGHVTLIKAEL